MCGLMQEIFQEYQSAKVCSGTDEAKRNGDICRWVFNDFWEFHVVVLCCVVDNVSVFTGDVLSSTRGFCGGQQLFSRIF